MTNNFKQEIYNLSTKNFIFLTGKQGYIDYLINLQKQSYMDNIENKDKDIKKINKFIKDLFPNQKSKPKVILYMSPKTKERFDKLMEDEFNKK